MQHVSVDLGIEAVRKEASQLLNALSLPSYTEIDCKKSSR